MYPYHSLHVWAAASKKCIVVWSGLRKELVLSRLAHWYHIVCNVYMVSHSHHIYTVHTPVVKQISALYYSAAQNVLHISVNMICWIISWFTHLADQVQAHSMISPIKPVPRAFSESFSYSIFNCSAPHLIGYGLDSTL